MGFPFRQCAQPCMLTDGHRDDPRADSRTCRSPASSAAAQKPSAGINSSTAARFFQLEPHLQLRRLAGIKVIGRTVMRYQNAIAAIVLVSALSVTITDTQAWDDSKYPDFKGQ